MEYTGLWHAAAQQGSAYRRERPPCLPTRNQLGSSFIKASPKEEVVSADNQRRAVDGKATSRKASNGAGAAAPAPASAGQGSMHATSQPSWMGKRVGRFRLVGLL